MFFCAGVVFRPPACATGTSSDGSGVARHFLPLPRAHRRFIDDFTLAMLHDGPVHRGGPPKPRNPTGTCDSLEFRFSQDPPKQQDPKGFRVACSCVGFWGFGFNSKPQPHRRVGLKIPPLARRVHSPVVRHTGTLSAIGIPKLSFANLHPGWGSQNRMNGGDEMPADREQRWVDFLIDFQRQNLSPFAGIRKVFGQTETALESDFPPRSLACPHHSKSRWGDVAGRRGP